MRTNLDSFNPADIQVEKAKVVYPELLVKILKKCDCVLVTGGKLLESELIADLAVELIKKAKLKVFATGGSSKALIERGINKKDVKVVPLHALVQYLHEVNFQKTLIFFGFEPYFLSRMLSSLKHFTKVVTISIDQTYQPQARLSFPTAFDVRFTEMLVSLLQY